MVATRNVRSGTSLLRYNVAQGFILRPFLFTIYLQSLGCVIWSCGHLYYIYALDSQLYNSAALSDVTGLVDCTWCCVECHNGGWLIKWMLNKLSSCWLVQSADCNRWAFFSHILSDCIFYMTSVFRWPTGLWCIYWQDLYLSLT